MSLEERLANELTVASREAEDWRRRRDQLILEAHAVGGSLREIAARVGMSNPGVLRVVRRGTDQASKGAAVSIK